jgi:hypothetical protein
MVAMAAISATPKTILKTLELDIAVHLLSYPVERSNLDASQPTPEACVF